MARFAPSFLDDELSSQGVHFNCGDLVGLELMKLIAPTKGLRHDSPSKLYSFYMRIALKSGYTPGMFWLFDHGKSISPDYLLNGTGFYSHTVNKDRRCLMLSPFYAIIIKVDGRIQRAVSKHSHNEFSFTEMHF